MICDGVVDSCTAALSTPYLVPPHGTGDKIWTPSALREVVTKADSARLQVALHAIGDAVINDATNVLEGLGTTGRRHRIEHLELTHPNDAKRLGKLGITASIQPVDASNRAERVIGSVGEPTAISLYVMSVNAITKPVRASSIDDFRKLPST